MVLLDRAASTNRRSTIDVPGTGSAVAGSYDQRGGRGSRLVGVVTGNGSVTVLAPAGGFRDRDSLTRWGSARVPPVAGGARAGMPVHYAERTNGRAREADLEQSRLRARVRSESLAKAAVEQDRHRPQLLAHGHPARTGH